jgi:L-alanine-DL-glutamate epimerase-like enolase superfamily enzyme
MKILEIRCFPIRVRPVAGKSSDPAVRARQTIIVSIRTDSPLTGVGEAASDRSDATRTLSALHDWLKAYAAALLGADALNINLVHRVLDEVGGRHSLGCPTARAAIDIAVYDLIGKARRCPVHQLLGGAYRTEFELLSDITAATEPAAAARSAIGRGYRGVKLSIGGARRPSEANAHFERTSQDLVAVLEAVGGDVYVDADANQSLGNPALANILFEKILAERFWPNLALQQPLHHLDLKGHALLREKLPIPIILDDPVTSPEAVAQIVRLGAADRILLSVERVGGLGNAMRIADICEAAAIGVNPASRSYTRIGNAALCHLAATLHDPYPIDIGDYLGLTDLPIVGGPEISGGRAVLGSQPGLGIEIDEDALRAMARDD